MYFLKAVWLIYFEGILHCIQSSLDLLWQTTKTGVTLLKKWKLLYRFVAELSKLYVIMETKKSIKLKPIIDHIQITVKNLEVAELFYDKL